MPEVKIETTHLVRCPQFANAPIVLSICKVCPDHCYETCDGKVICNWDGPTPIPPKKPRK